MSAIEAISMGFPGRVAPSGSCPGACLVCSMQPARERPATAPPSAARTQAQPLPGQEPWRPSLQGDCLLIAHRGGAGLAPENTVAAVRQAVADWAADMVELDVHASADGHCVVIHDETVDRTTDGSGAVAQLTLSELRRLDAGFRFTSDGATSFPFRGQGVRIPTLQEVLQEFPDLRLIVEVKAAAAQRPMFEAIRNADAQRRVIVASIGTDQRSLFHTYQGQISASGRVCRRFTLLHWLGIGRYFPPKADVVQLPCHWRGIRVISPRLIADLHHNGLPVHAWTINVSDTMRRLLEWGIDGIITDRPDRLADLLSQHMDRPPAPRRLSRRTETSQDDDSTRSG